MSLEPWDLPDLISERLTLRKLSESDVPALFDIFSNPEVMRFWSSPPFQDISQAQKLLAGILDGYRTGSSFQLAIEISANHTVIGTCSVIHIHRTSRRAEIGYALARPFWGVGYMNEALSVLFDYLFFTLDLNRLEADIDPRNVASARVLERLGFQKEGFLPERWIVADEVSDSALYGLLKSAWQQNSIHSTRSGR
jgi:ribosomal-protein-alanine N-acetyltransferase